jgi:hypothetical protein
MSANLGITSDEALPFTGMNDNQACFLHCYLLDALRFIFYQQFLTVTQLSNLVQTKNLAPFKSNFFRVIDAALLRRPKLLWSCSALRSRRRRRINAAQI